MQNLDIRQEIRESGFKLWEVAYALGLHDGNFSKKLRRELPDCEKRRIRQTIQLLKEGMENDK